MAEEYDYLFKVCLFADKDVGKKTLARFLEKVGSDLNYGSTIGVDFFSKNIEIKGKKAKLQLWIFSDKEDYGYGLIKMMQERNITFLYHFFINGSNGVILLYDITNSKSLDFLSIVLQDVKKAREKYDFPLLLVGNKLDLEEYREVSNDQVKKFKEENNISESMEISLQTRENVEKKMFRKFIEMILNQD